MSKKGWHLNALNGPAAVHIACTRLTLQVVETFTSDLNAFVAEARNAPEGKGTMVALYDGLLSFARATPYASPTLYWVSEARVPSAQRSLRRLRFCEYILGYAVQGVNERCGGCRGLIYWTIFFFLLACRIYLESFYDPWMKGLQRWMLERGIERRTSCRTT